MFEPQHASFPGTPSPQPLVPRGLRHRFPGLGRVPRCTLTTGKGDLANISEIC